MAGCRKTPLKSGKYRGWYTNFQGKVTDFVGTTSAKETLHMANSFEDHHRKIRLGYAPIPKANARARDFKSTVEEYFEAGNANGGRNGFGWSLGHAKPKSSRLTHWRKSLGLNSLQDLDGCLSSVEKELRRLKETGLAGKTVNGYADALSSFCDWCKQRGYIDENPIVGIKLYNDDPEETKRELSVLEIQAILALPLKPNYRLFYTMALCSGFRRGELRALRVKHLGPTGVKYEAAWTKARKAGFQPLPGWMVAELAKAAQGKKPEDRLLRLPVHTNRFFEKHLVKAKVLIETPEGVASFHCLRHTYITLVEKTGAREIYRKVLARHAVSGLTDSTYTHLDKAELSRIVEQVGNWILKTLPPSPEKDLAHSWHKVAVGAEGESVSTVEGEVYKKSKVVEVMGVEPTTSALRTQRSPN
jgi:integrase